MSESSLCYVCTMRSFQYLFFLFKEQNFQVYCLFSPGTGRKLGLWEEPDLCATAANKENPLFQDYCFISPGTGRKLGLWEEFGLCAAAPNENNLPFHVFCVILTWHRAEARPLRGTWSLCRCCQWGERPASDRWCTDAASACPILNTHSAHMYRTNVAMFYYLKRSPNGL